MGTLDKDQNGGLSLARNPLLPLHRPAAPSEQGEPQLSISKAEDIRYLAEGNANVIFELMKRTEPRQVLRVRKEGDHTFPASVTYEFFQTKIRPLFTYHQVMHPKLAKLNPSTVEQLNMAMMREELRGSRPEKRRGIFVDPNEPYATILPDMRPHKDGEWMIELKPKWLVQSPSAPAGFKRCRTCALREMRAFDARRSAENDPKPKPTDKHPPPFCPLDLLSTDIHRLRSIVKSILMTDVNPSSSSSQHQQDILTTHFAHALRSNPTLTRLHALQSKHNAVGLPSILRKDDSMALSMTLRDCTLFLKLHIVVAPTPQQQQPITSKSDDSPIPTPSPSPSPSLQPPSTTTITTQTLLSDLDPKKCSPQNFGKWARIERRLIDEGWYTMTESSSDNVGEKSTEEVPCRIGRMLN